MIRIAWNAGINVIIINPLKIFAFMTKFENDYNKGEIRTLPAHPACDYTRSKIAAMPCPPPIHMVTNA